MSSRRTKTSGVKSCTCDRCGLELISVPGKKHRRCGGEVGAKPRPKHSPHNGVRGTWR